ncbi:GGDEF: diguanylate cyclase (GGDEF) domain [Solimicrobium silvestre]|uniref:diguanylate cyclase n=2 Tax=Solimicrobium silvestre TaxID=2099400 RepID=A0A2S9H182_9BURK|nr:GGDEF: diguanylate cyclase (GGDEF) domain [Solimicrobium silvestre]
MRHLYKKYRLLVWLGLLLIIGIVANSAVTLYSTRALMVQTSAQKTLPLTGDSLSAEIQRNIARSILTSARMADDAVVRDWILSDEHDSARLLAHLKSAQQKDQSTSHFLVTEKDRQFYDSQGVIRTINPENFHDTWYFKTRAAKHAYETTVAAESDETNHPNLYISYRIQNSEGKFLGAAGVSMPLELVTKAMDHYVNDFKRSVYFVDTSGKIVLSDNQHNLHGNIHEQEGIKQIAEEILNNEHTELNSSYELAATNILFNARYIPELGWHLIVESDAADEAAQVQPLFFVNAAIGVIITTLALLLAWFSIAHHQSRLLALTNCDGMTGLMNRQSFTTSFQQTVLDMRRAKYPLSFILFDIDFLKKINELHGHVTGDQIIMDIARMSKESVRGSDLLCRWGGEQFALLLKKCELEQAYKVAEQLRLNVQNHAFSIADGAASVTISLGVAEWAENESADELFARVDEAMYFAKSEGRNRAEVSYYVSG